MDPYQIFVLSFGVFGFVALIISLLRGRRPIILPEPQKIDMPHIPDYSMLMQSLSERLTTLETEIPGKVLRTIQGNTATMKGELAEHISYLKLHSVYDRLIPLGSVVDFIGIKFDKDRESEDGHIDFIDIKTGKHSRLSQEQMKTRRLVQGGRTNFLKVKITTDPGVKSDAD
ncbi:MAG: hypothetical protein GQ553_00305 [Nitrosomonadaceae bacterium]|nr:hypothetical protein [Nitrosomonadaceae bacterium]